MNNDFAEKLLDRLYQAQKVVALTGAGISKESGIPTFRGKDGLWKELSPQELASFEAFYNNTAMVSKWYHHRREIIEKTDPNPGHYALAELENLLSNLVIITQNVDNLHQDAGSQEVIELHGNIMRNYCVECGKYYKTQEFDEIYNSSPDNIPHCYCGGLIRPDVVWFGEPLPQDSIQKAIQSSSEADIFLSIGTSAQVVPAAELPYFALRSKAMVVEINPNQTPLSNKADLVFRRKAGEILPELVEQFKTKYVN